MRILHILAPAKVGGLERVVQALAVGHRARGHEVTAMLVTTGREGDDLASSLDAAGVGVRRCVVGHRDYLGERRGVAGVCRELRPDVVHTHGYRPDVVDAGVARRLGCPTVATVHGFIGGGWKNRLNERFQLAALRRFDAVVAVSSPLRDRLLRARVPRERLHLVRNARPPCGRKLLDPVRAREALGALPDGFLVGWVGRLGPEKGIDIFVEALGRLPDVPFHAAVVGDGPLRSDVRSRAAALGLADRIRWTGLVPDAARLFRAFDLFVLSSRTEGTPIVLLEAMAAGVPILATRVGGVPDVVTPAEALIVPPDDPAALAAAIRRAHAEPDAARERVRAARARLESMFAYEPWLARYETIYDDIRSRSHRSGG